MKQSGSEILLCLKLYVPEVKTLHIHCCENLECTFPFFRSCAKEIPNIVIDWLPFEPRFSDLETEWIELCVVFLSPCKLCYSTLRYAKTTSPLFLFIF
jgi:hypothetical protein